MLAQVRRRQARLQRPQREDVVPEVIDPIEHPVDRRARVVHRRLTSHPVITPSPKAKPKVVSGRFSTASISIQWRGGHAPTCEFRPAGRRLDHLPEPTGMALARSGLLQRARGSSPTIVTRHVNRSRRDGGQRRPE